MEKWKKAVGYEGYEISNLGNVRSCEKVCKNGVVIPTHQLSCTIDKNGYRYVVFNKNHIYKRLRVSRLVASAFIPNPNNLPQVNHKNENRTDDRVENLEWCTAKHNANYGDRNKRISEGNKGKRPGELCYFKTHKYIFKGANHYKATPIIQYDLNNNFIAEYPSIVDASKITGIPQSSISHGINSDSNRSCGYLWKKKQRTKNETY